MQGQQVWPCARPVPTSLTTDISSRESPFHPLSNSSDKALELGIGFSSEKMQTKLLFPLNTSTPRFPLLQYSGQGFLGRTLRLGPLLNVSV